MHAFHDRLVSPPTHHLAHHSTALRLRGTEKTRLFSLSEVSAVTAVEFDAGVCRDACLRNASPPCCDLAESDLYFAAVISVFFSAFSTRARIGMSCRVGPRLIFNISGGRPLSCSESIFQMPLAAGQRILP